MLALFLRMFFIAILGLFASRFMLQHLGEVDFGIYNVIGGTVNLMAFFNIVLASATNRFLITELGKGEKGDLSKIFSASIHIHFFIGILIILFGETIGLYYINNFLNVPDDKLLSSQIIYQISLFSCAICVLQVPFQGLLISFEDFTRYSIVQVAMVVVVLFSSITIGYIDNYRLIWFSVFMAFSQIVGYILFFFVSRKYSPTFSWRIDRKVIKNMLNFSGWIALGAASHMGKNQGSNIILNYFFGPVVNSAFSIGNQVNSQISHLSESVSKSFNPQIMMNYVSGNKERMCGLMVSCSKFSFFLLYFVAFIFFIKVEYILHLWLGVFPYYTAIFCVIIMIDILISSLSYGFHPAIQASGRIKPFQIIGSVVTVLTIPLACITFLFGAKPYMLSLTFLSTSVLFTIINLILLQKVLNLSCTFFFKRIFVRVVFVVMLTIPFIYLGRILFNDSIQGLFESVLLAFLVVPLAIYFLGLDQSERHKLKIYIKKRTSRIIA